jgi:hypothetical protein
MINTLWILLYLWIFWYMYILVMGLYRAHLSKRLTYYTYFLAGPAVLIGLVMDVVANICISIPFWEGPKEWLVTTRLSRYSAVNTDWRSDVAKFICANFLDFLDPTGKHCKT